MIQHITNTVAAIPETIKIFLLPVKQSENPQTSESMLTVNAVISKKYVISKPPVFSDTLRIVFISLYFCRAFNVIK